ncbi:I-set domain containing protein [Trichuris trichiura]|uniref:I-set domain containing protein n=1 Tax=Trichuris trichiura TaxID=36087 RepID=A0A077Z2Y8_TRITR|nr:I-set domain containing protein [Trichuris trichiura]
MFVQVHVSTCELVTVGTMEKERVAAEVCGQILVGTIEQALAVFAHAGQQPSAQAREGTLILPTVERSSLALCRHELKPFTEVPMEIAHFEHVLAKHEQPLEVEGTILFQCKEKCAANVGALPLLPSVKVTVLIKRADEQQGCVVYFDTALTFASVSESVAMVRKVSIKPSLEEQLSFAETSVELVKASPQALMDSIVFSMSAESIESSVKRPSETVALRSEILYSDKTAVATATLKVTNEIRVSADILRREMQIPYAAALHEEQVDITVELSGGFVAATRQAILLGETFEQNVISLALAKQRLESIAEESISSEIVSKPQSADLSCSLFSIFAEHSAYTVGFAEASLEVHLQTAVAMAAYEHPSVVQLSVPVTTCSSEVFSASRVFENLIPSACFDITIISTPYEAVSKVVELIPTAIASSEVIVNLSLEIPAASIVYEDKSVRNFEALSSTYCIQADTVSADMNAQLAVCLSEALLLHSLMECVSSSVEDVAITVRPATFYEAEKLGQLVECSFEKASSHLRVSLERVEEETLLEVVFSAKAQHHSVQAEIGFFDYERESTFLLLPTEQKLVGKAAKAPVDVELLASKSPSVEAVSTKAMASDLVTAIVGVASVKESIAVHLEGTKLQEEAVVSFKAVAFAEAQTRIQQSAQQSDIEATFRREAKLSDVIVVPTQEATSELGAFNFEAVIVEYDEVARQVEALALLSLCSPLHVEETNVLSSSEATAYLEELLKGEVENITAVMQTLSFQSVVAALGLKEQPKVEVCFLKDVEEEACSSLFGIRSLDACFCSLSSDHSIDLTSDLYNEAKICLDVILLQAMSESSSLDISSKVKLVESCLQSPIAERGVESVLQEAKSSSVSSDLSVMQIKTDEELHFFEEAIDLTVAMFYPAYDSAAGRFAEASSRTSSIDIEARVELSKSSREAVEAIKELASTSVVQPLVHTEIVVELERKPFLEECQKMAIVIQKESCALSIGEKVTSEASTTVTCELTSSHVQFNEAYVNLMSEIPVSRERFAAEIAKEQEEAMVLVELEIGPKIELFEFQLLVQEFETVEQTVRAPEKKRFESFDEIYQTEEIRRPSSSISIEEALGKWTFAARAVDICSQEVDLSAMLSCVQEVKEIATGIAENAEAASMNLTSASFALAQEEKQVEAIVPSSEMTAAMVTLTSSIVRQTIALEEELGEAPSFALPLSSLSVAEGSFVRLKCIVQGKPEPTVHWYIDGDRISSSKDFKIIYEDGVAMLEIKEVYPEDEGEYSCEATNYFGTSSTSAYLAIARKLLFFDSTHIGSRCMLCFGSAPRPHKRTVGGIERLQDVEKLTRFDALAELYDELRGQTTTQAAADIHAKYADSASARAVIRSLSETENVVDLSINMQISEKLPFDVTAICHLYAVECVHAVLRQRLGSKDELLCHEDVSIDVMLDRSGQSKWMTTSRSTIAEKQLTEAHILQQEIAARSEAVVVANIVKSMQADKAAATLLYNAFAQCTFEQILRMSSALPLEEATAELDVLMKGRDTTDATSLTVSKASLDQALAQLALLCLEIQKPDIVATLECVQYVWPFCDVVLTLSVQQKRPVEETLTGSLEEFVSFQFDKLNASKDSASLALYSSEQTSLSDVKIQADLERILRRESVSRIGYEYATIASDLVSISQEGISRVSASNEVEIRALSEYKKEYTLSVPENVESLLYLGKTKLFRAGRHPLSRAVCYRTYGFVGG